MSQFNIYSINSAMDSNAKPVIMIGQEEGWGNIRRIVPNPSHPVPGYAITPDIISPRNPNIRVSKIASFKDFHQALSAATNIVRKMGISV